MLYLLKPTKITDAMFVSSVVPEADAAVYNPATNYAIAVEVMYQHVVYESLQADNMGHTPGDLDDEGWWNEMRPTNRWAIFDQKGSTSTEWTTTIDDPAWTVRVKPGVLNGVNVRGMVNVQAARCQMFNGLTQVFDQIAVLDVSVIDDAYKYYFSPFDISTDVIFGPLPPFYNAEVLITLTPATVGDTVKCAGVQYGVTVELGEVRYGVAVEFKDYSIKEVDRFKQFTLIEGDFSDCPHYIIELPRAKLREVASTLKALRATPCAFVLGNDYQLTPFNAYGFPRSFSLVLEEYDLAYADLVIEGM